MDASFGELNSTSVAINGTNRHSIPSPQPLEAARNGIVQRCFVFLFGGKRTTNQRRGNRERRAPGCQKDDRARRRRQLTATTRDPINKIIMQPDLCLKQGNKHRMLYSQIMVQLIRSTPPISARLQPQLPPTSQGPAARTMPQPSRFAISFPLKGPLIPVR